MSWETFVTLPSYADLIYDEINYVIYHLKKFDTLNGSDMNLEQAVLAYIKVNNIRE